MNIIIMLSSYDGDDNCMLSSRQVTCVDTHMLAAE